MEWNAIEGSWKQVSATMKEKWSALTDADLQYVDKSKEALVAKVRERTGLEQNSAERQLDAVIASVRPSPAAVEKPAEPVRMPPSGAKPEGSG